MDTNAILGVIVVLAAVIVIAIAVLAVRRRRQSEELEDRFGPEYERTVNQYGSRDKAEQELRAREKRVESFNLKPLDTGERDRLTEEWRVTQAEFVDAPGKAIRDADRLVQEAMQARGYPVGDFEQRATDISVDHPNVVTHYRTAHEIAQREERGKATTEDLRQAMVHYRALFQDLLADTTEAPAPEETPTETEKERTK